MYIAHRHQEFIFLHLFTALFFKDISLTLQNRSRYINCYYVEYICTTLFWGTLPLAIVEYSNCSSELHYVM